jgi:DnaK suppressor protein
MHSKKPNKSAKKPGKAIPKKVTPKSAAPKKTARPPTKATPKPVLPKVAVKPTKSVPKSATAKPAATKAPKPKAPTPGVTATKPESTKDTSEKAAPIKFDIRPLVMPRPASNGEEDGEFESPTAASLLAGPRNVKPYIARRGEQYMNKEQLEHFARILQSWKRDLMVEVDRTVLHMKDEAANFPDPNDRATQEEEFSLELRTRDRERKLIRKIDEALKRIEDGSYGYCLETGEEIGIKRLEARPVATLSVEAQERRERREKQYGDRDDRYR